MPEMPLNREFQRRQMSGGFSNQKAMGNLPESLPQPLLLNLGCGNDIRDGFLNIDLYSSDPRVIYMDIRKLELPDNCADLILASDILEHFSHREVPSILNEWARVLKARGDIIIRCPSLYLQVKAYMNKIWDADIASYMIFGGQTNPGDFHCVGFDKDSITRHLSGAGFEIEEITEHDTPQDKGFINLNMTVKAKKKAEQSKKAAAQEWDLFSSVETEETQAETKAANVPDTEESQEEAEICALPQIKEPELKIDTANFLQYGIAPTESKLNLVWEGSQFVYHSLALINREICSEILKTGLVNLNIVPYEPEQFDPGIKDKYVRLFANDVRVKPKAEEAIAKLPYCWVRHQWPPQKEAPKGAKWIIMQPWEFSSHRTDFVSIFKQADEIWTPSNYSRKTFLDAGIEFDKLQIIPNGIDPELFKPDGDKYPLDTDKKFKLLYLGGTIYRKGIDILLKAYLSAFTKADDVCLIIKDMGGKTFYKDRRFTDDIEKAKSDPKAAEILYIDDELTEAEIASLYRACNVFVCPYRGEGFSLPTLEAMACGLPVIVTEGGATDDFVDEEVGWMIPADTVSLGTTLDGMPMTDDVKLLNPDTKYLADLMREVYLNPYQIYSTGLVGSARARENWTWRRSALKVLSRIDVLYDTDISKEAVRRLPIFEDAAIFAGKAEREFLRREFSRAEEYFSAALNKTIDDNKLKLHILARLVEINLIMDNPDNAEIYLNDIVKMNGDEPLINYLKSKLSLSRGDSISALEEITKFLEIWFPLRYDMPLNLSHDGLLVFTADLLYSDEDFESAHQLYTEALKINNNNAYACYGAGMCFKSAGATKEARNMFEWALKLEPDLKEAEIELLTM